MAPPSPRTAVKASTASLAPCSTFARTASIPHTSTICATASFKGPPFSADERERILEYCQNDVEALACLVRHLVPTIPSLPHAIARCNVTWALAQQEHRGVPIALPLLEQIRQDWSAIQLDLVRERDRFGLYEVDENGKPHWRRHLFKDLVKRAGWAWPAYDDGNLDETEQTFREMAGRYPEVETIRELRYSLSKLRLNDLAVGNDGRNRVLLGPYGTKTGRNAPSKSQVRVRAGEVDQAPDRTTTRAYPGSSGLHAARSADRRGIERRQRAVGGL